MESSRNQREVENRLRDALKYDRARVQMGKISRFGLLELSRQRLRPSLGETSHSPCPRCHGTGHIRGCESTALHILRIIQEEAMKDNTAAVHAQVPVDVATFLLNEKRVDLQLVEARHRVSVTLIPNMHLETPNYSVTRLRHDDLNNAEPMPPSYEMVEAPSDEKLVPEGAQEPAVPRPQAVVRGITPQQPAPVSRHETPAVPGLAAEDHSIIGKIFGWFRRKPGEPLPPPTEPERAPAARPAPRARRESGRFRSEEREGGTREGARRERQPAQSRARAEAPAQAGEQRRERDASRRRGGEQQRDERRGERTRGDGGSHGRQQHARAEAQPPQVVPLPLTGEPTESADRQSQPSAPAQEAQKPPREHGEGRGRRRRGRRGERHETRAEQLAEIKAGPVPGAEPLVEAADSALVVPPVEPERTEPVVPSPLAEPASSWTAEPEPMHEPERSKPAEEPAAPVVAEPAAQDPAPATTAHARNGATPESVLASLQVSWPADLVQVETDPLKVQPRPEFEEILGLRAGRTRPVFVPLSEEPLVQVETRKRDSAGGGSAQPEIGHA